MTGRLSKILSSEHARDMCPATSSTPGRPAPAGRARVNRLPWIAVGLAFAALPAVLFPGDAPFVNDEPTLILLALKANAAHTLAASGLAGTRGVPYGPFSVWIYQALLCLTHDPIKLVMVHAVALAFGTLLALHLISRDARLWPAFAVVIALSPHLWFQARQLWDNPFNIPVCALALAAYVCFLANRSPLALALAISGMAIAPLIHLMALAFVVPVALHMLVFERRALWRNAPLLLPVPIVLYALSWRYLRALFTSLHGSAEAVASSSSGARAFAFPLLGGRVLSAMGFFDHWTSSAWVKSARVVSGIAFPLVWAGAAVACARVVSVIRGRRAAEVQDHLAGLALSIVIAQCLLDGLMKLTSYTHYFNATWIAYAVLAWLVVDSLVRARSRWLRRLAWLAPLHGSALLVVNVASVAVTHTSPGSQYGVNLANQVEVAREIARYPANTPVTSDLFPYQPYMQALTAMRMLVGGSQPPTASAERLVIRSFRSSSGNRAVVVAE
jgi:hypothetical protein